jgi:thiamine-phosphate pyrophosphorylase
VKAADSHWIDFNLYLITDRKQTEGRSLYFVIEEALRGGVRAVQLREKDLPTKELYETAYELRKLTARHNAKLFINDRVDIVLAVDADGVHLGYNSLPLYKVRRLIGEKKLIAVSCHNLVQAITAQEMGADFITFGPIFYTPSKAPFGDPVGLKKLEEVTSLIEIPVFGLGGIMQDNAHEVIRAGAHGIALVSSIMAAPEPRDAARNLFSRIPAMDQSVE